MSVLGLAKTVCVVVGAGSVLWGGMVAASSGAAPSDGISRPSTESQTVKNYAFLHGQWFDGKTFHPATWYSSQGRLTRTAPAGVVETVDLAGGFVVPPFGEAHNHNVEGEWNVQVVIDRYLKDGVFYVKNPNNVRDFAVALRNRVNRPHTIDAVFAHAGMTGTGGHPTALYEDTLRVYRYEPVIGHREAGWFQNRAYVVVDRERDLDEKWGLITSGNPDFLKAYLVHSEDFAAHQLDMELKGRTGLNPALLPRIVTKAHAVGLPVTVHVESASDFRTAVEAGADEIAHVPGWLVESAVDAERARLTEEDARLAAEKGIVVVTTTIAGEAMPGTASAHAHGHNSDHAKPETGSVPHGEGMDLRALARDVQRANLTLLRRHGVKLAIGSDHAETSLAEVMNLKLLLPFDNLTLLKLWCEATPTAIFPGRKIARFEEGYEASFLALAGNPLEDFTQVQAIRLRFKQGFSLPFPVQGGGTSSMVTGHSHAH
jgi:imidazolonepropionase-like amidohydrolase